MLCCARAAADRRRTEYGDEERGGRDILHDDEHEDSHGEEKGDGEADLLATLGWQAEDEHADEEEQDAGEEQVEEVEERTTGDLDGEDDLRRATAMSQRLTTRDEPNNERKTNQLITPIRSGEPH